METTPIVRDLRLKWHGQTDRGKVRKNNEDSFLALQFNAEDVRYLGKVGDTGTKNYDFVFAVSDGMGGAKAGEFASRITVEKITRLLPRSFKNSVEGLGTGFHDILSELFDQIHKALQFVGGSYEECHGMEATLSLCWFTPSWLYFAHVGDSRIYYLAAGSHTLKQLSEDDTHVGWLLRNGQITEYEARNHPRKSVLQKSLGGTGKYVDPQVGAVGYDKGDIFLLCTDGMVDGLYDHAIIDILRGSSADKDENIARVLVEQSIAASGKDNTTALVIEVL